jgi:hypothetical protein
MSRERMLSISPFQREWFLPNPRSWAGLKLLLSPRTGWLVCLLHQSDKVGDWRIAYQALVVEGGMKEGDNVLIHAVRLSSCDERRSELMAGRIRSRSRCHSTCLYAHRRGACISELTTSERHRRSQSLYDMWDRWESRFPQETIKQRRKTTCYQLQDPKSVPFLCLSVYPLTSRFRRRDQESHRWCWSRYRVHWEIILDPELECPKKGRSNGIPSIHVWPRIPRGR